MVFIASTVVSSSRLSLLSNVFKRHSSTRPHIQKPKTPHFERQKYLILTRPLLEPHPEESLPQSMKCRVKLENQKHESKLDDPYARLMGQKVFKMWDEAKMILFFQHNSIKGEEHFNYKVQFYRQQMLYKQYFPSTMRAALKDTKFDNIFEVYSNNSCFVVSPEVKVTEALKLLKKMPNLILLTAIIDNRMLSRAEIETYNSIGNITNARAQLVSTLNAAGQSLVSNATSLQQNLVSLLEQHINQLKDSSSAGAPLSGVSNSPIDAASETSSEELNASTSSEASSNASETESKINEAEKSKESADGSSSSSDSDSDSDSDSEKKK